MQSKTTKKQKCKFNKTKDNGKTPVSCTAGRQRRWGTKLPKKNSSLREPKQENDDGFDGHKHNAYCNRNDDIKNTFAPAIHVNPIVGP